MAPYVADMKYTPNLPGVIILSELDADTLDWMSDGWYDERARQTTAGQHRMELACQAIQSSYGTMDAIRRLKAAGFAVYDKEGEVL